MHEVSKDLAWWGLVLAAIGIALPPKLISSLGSVAKFDSVNGE